jgi:hypothetical protein
MAAPSPQPDIIPKQLFDARLKSNEILQEHLKQLITVASAALALTVTFLKDVVGPSGGDPRASAWLQWCWYLLAAAIGTAIFTIAALVNNLDNEKVPSGSPPGPNKSFAAGADRCVQIPVLIGILLFVGALVCLTRFGSINYEFIMLRSKSLGATDISKYAVPTEVQALAAAKLRLPRGASIARLLLLRLNHGATPLPFGAAVWRVQLAVRMHTPDPTKAQPRTSILDFYIDARTGRTVAIP